MSESKMVTEREAILRERAAYERGSKSWSGVISGSLHAELVYPLPKVERPRVVAEDGPGLDGDTRRWRVVSGHLETSFRGGEWIDSIKIRGVPICTERVKLWADLLANPTELVEDTP